MHILYFICWCPVKIFSVGEHLLNSQPYHSPALLLGWWRKLIQKQSRKIQSLPFNVASMHSDIFCFFPGVVMEALGSKCGQLQSCHLGFTCFRKYRWMSSLHSTHGNTIHSTRWHAALEISLVLWSHWGLKKAHRGNLIHCGSGNCQWKAWECAPVVN